MSKRTRKVRKRPSRSSLLAGSPELASVRIDATTQGPIDAKPARRVLPTAPHPDNAKLVGPPRIVDGLTLREWLRKRAAETSEIKPGVSHAAWLGWEKMAKEMEDRLAAHVRHGDKVVGFDTMEYLRSGLARLREDLDRTRPF